MKAGEQQAPGRMKASAHDQGSQHEYPRGRKALSTALQKKGGQNESLAASFCERGPCPLQGFCPRSQKLAAKRLKGEFGPFLRVAVLRSCPQAPGRQRPSSAPAWPAAT